MKTVITKNSKETQKLGAMLASEIISGQKRTVRLPRADSPLSNSIVCLEGDLGSGKTTFAQGLLKGLNVTGPFTSPTFVILKQYKPTTHNQQPTTKGKKKLSVASGKLSVIYHIDAYRVAAKDILNLGWKELVAEKNNIIIIEWADRIRKVIPRGAVWIKFENISENEREITFK